MLWIIMTFALAYFTPFRLGFMKESKPAWKIEDSTTEKASRHRNYVWSVLKAVLAATYLVNSTFCFIFFICKMRPQDAWTNISQEFWDPTKMYTGKHS